jgi:hypothetical protein
MPDKKKLDDLIAKGNKPQELQRGKGMSLSTNKPIEDALTHNRTTAYVRISRGYKLREDLVKECKRIALEDDRNLYEVMDDALEQYIERWKAAQTKPKEV